MDVLIGEEYSSMTTENIVVSGCVIDDVLVAGVYVQSGRVRRASRKHQFIRHTNIPRSASAASNQPDTE